MFFYMKLTISQLIKYLLATRHAFFVVSPLYNYFVTYISQQTHAQRHSALHWAPPARRRKEIVHSATEWSKTAKSRHQWLFKQRTLASRLTQLHQALDQSLLSREFICTLMPQWLRDTKPTTISWKICSSNLRTFIILPSPERLGKTLAYADSITHLSCGRVSQRLLSRVYDFTKDRAESERTESRSKCIKANRCMQYVTSGGRRRAAALERSSVSCWSISPAHLEECPPLRRFWKYERGGPR